jgi:hypothetical protein
MQHNTQHATRITRRPRRRVVDAATLATIRQHAHLIPATIDPLAVAQHHAALCADQERRIAAGLPTSPVPLVWLALAMAAGLSVDVESGRIIDGPRAAVTVVVDGWRWAGEVGGD